MASATLKDYALNYFLPLYLYSIFLYRKILIDFSSRSILFETPPPKILLPCNSIQCSKLTPLQTSFSFLSAPSPAPHSLSSPHQNSPTNPSAQPGPLSTKVIPTMDPSSISSPPSPQSLVQSSKSARAQVTKRVSSQMKT